MVVDVVQVQAVEFKFTKKMKTKMRQKMTIFVQAMEGFYFSKIYLDLFSILFLKIEIENEIKI